MRAKQSFGVAAVVALAMVGAGCDGGKGADDPALIVGRVWIDSNPQQPTDYVQALYLLPRPSIGVFQRASNYDFRFERIDYKREGQGLGVTFPQSGKHEDVTFTVTPCTTLPPFDLCLDLSANPWGGPKRYFAKRQQDDEDERAGKAMAARVQRP